MTTAATQNGLFSIIASELQAVEERLQEPVEESGCLLSAVAGYSLASGGKRIRPALVLLAARACGAEEQDRLAMLAAVVEVMHAASLIHDDIVDHSEMRRGRPSAKARWGSDVSVLVGDYLYSRAIQTVVADGDMRILRVLADAIVAMTQGEVLQLEFLHDLKISERDYLRIITNKTAVLMAAACRVGALAAGAPPPLVETLGAFGLNLGVGFQLVDDALDYSAREERLGKPVGSDFREGKITYPVIHLMRIASVEDRAILERLPASVRGGEADLAPLHALVERYRAIPATMRVVDDYLERARGYLRPVPDSPACGALHRLVDFVRERDW